ncbi:unnamed protein product [Didymodactylos carnosus]|uniref:Glyoxalase-like domain-containing protein n=1 Tax=Didymodactylos carnosus TaxID=1234261 RepID=A0A814FPE0_9BILA|nr:unnamed protein product [Didymodactylos carnosus]CAF0984047.1 unnamed protein product [Didymodactylos carnosus]CAF3692824.1 unnamed protein product [Didymodactylos carnosus]CAF3756340.1 unnamed protein product [Didymodactylos carnosus]
MSNDQGECSPLDHLVINTIFDLDLAVSQFHELGFTLTPRGYHSFGSMNNLIIFDNHYIELIGLPQDTDKLGSILLNSPTGINALVLRTSNADNIYETLTDKGFQTEKPILGSRPIHINGQEQLVKFRVVHLSKGQFDSGRIYFCEHYTPELVWRQEWQKHANGVQRIRELICISDQPEIEAGRYARAIGTTIANQTTRIFLNDFLISIISFNAYYERYGQLACDSAGRTSFFGAIVFQVAHLDMVRKFLDSNKNDMQHVEHSTNRSLVLLSKFNTLIEFVENQ